MAGLLNQKKKPPQADPNAQAAPVEQEDGNVSPEEQAQYDQFVGNGMNLIYNEQGLPQLVETLRGDGAPVEGLANALVMIVKRLEDSATEAGEQLSGDVMYHGGTELLEQLVEVAEKAGVHEFSQEEIEAALFQALDQYRVMKQEDGSLPVDELSADMQSLMEADKAGKAGEVLPGIEEYAKKAPKQEGAKK